MPAGKFDICAIIPTTRANAILAPIFSRIPLFQTAMPGLQLNPEPVAMGKLKTLIAPFDIEGTQTWHGIDNCRPRGQRWPAMNRTDITLI